MARTNGAHDDGRRRKPCPPHGPLLRETLAQGGYVLRCLSCGLSRYERDDQGAEAPDQDSDSLLAAS